MNINKRFTLYTSYTLTPLFGTLTILHDDDVTCSYFAILIISIYDTTISPILCVREYISITKLTIGALCAICGCH